MRIRNNYASCSPLNSFPTLCNPPSSIQAMSSTCNLRTYSPSRVAESGLPPPPRIEMTRSPLLRLSLEPDVEGRSRFVYVSQLISYHLKLLLQLVWRRSFPKLNGLHLQRTRRTYLHGSIFMNPTHSARWPYSYSSRLPLTSAWAKERPSKCTASISMCESPTYS